MFFFFLWRFSIIISSRRKARLVTIRFVYISAASFPVPHCQIKMVRFYFILKIFKYLIHHWVLNEWLEWRIIPKIMAKNLDVFYCPGFAFSLLIIWHLWRDVQKKVSQIVIFSDKWWRCILLKLHDLVQFKAKC